MTEKIAMVTGASSGIGEVTAEVMAKAGYTVVAVGRRKEALDAVVARITSAGGKALAVAADVAVHASVVSLFDTVRETYGRLDVIFNNAGINIPEATIDEIDPTDWRKVIDINLTGVFYCTQQAFAMMRAQDPQGGRIINNGSISAYMPRPMSAAYTSSKHGVLGITRQTALEGRDFSIACGQIDIGNAATAMTKKMVGGVTQADGTKAAEPRMDAQHVADAVVYMASLPLDANVLNMTVMATNMPFVGRG
jgi:NAD(P)-dependent dehydrogenase (short-subunit alcohol dehydrogenase family)